MKNLKKALLNNIKDLKDFQNHLFENGHDFWHCDAQDKEHKKPFYYFQINRTKHMSTCGTCQKLIENRKKIRAIQKLLGIDQDPLTSNFKEVNHIKRMSVSDSRTANPNYNYIS